MFNYEQIKKLSGLELTVYHYIIENVKAVQKMTIRELSEKSHVSTSTILRYGKENHYVSLCGRNEYKFTS